GSTIYHTPSAHRLHGALDEAAFNRAFNDIVRRQATLRTFVGSDNGTPVQMVAPSLDVTLFPAEDVSMLPEADRIPAVMERMEEEIARPLDLRRAPLFRIRVFRLGPEDHVLFFMPHHIIWDGWSFDLFYEEMATLYGGYISG